MTNTLKTAALASVAAMVLLAPLTAGAGGTLRLDEVAVGELDPAKASDYADSILMFNVYDTLVLPKQGGPGHVPHLAESWEGEGSSYTFTLRDDVSFQSGNPLTAEDVVFSIERMKALGQGLSFSVRRCRERRGRRRKDGAFHARRALFPLRGVPCAPADRRQADCHGQSR